LLSIDRLSVYENESIAIIGNNGVGKTTLLKLLSGELSPREGNIKRHVDYSYSHQLLEQNHDLREKMYNPKIEKLVQSYHGSMSGGEQAIIKMFNSMNGEKELILLDEPTTYLDYSSIEKIINYFRYRQCTLIFVSHNKHFINSLADKIWLIEDRTVKEYSGNYNVYIDSRNNEEIEHERKRERFLSEKNRLKKVVERKSISANKIMKVSKKRKSRNIKPNRLASTKQKDTVQKRMDKSTKSTVKKIDMLDVVKKKVVRKPIRYPEFYFVEQYSKFPIVADNLEVSVKNIKLIKDINFQIPLGKRVGITGGNGSGKTSLLNCINNRLDGVIISKSTVISYFSQFCSLGDRNDSVFTYLKSLDNMPDRFVTSILINLGFDYSDLKRKICTLSGGEIVRLNLVSTFLKRSNVLILDEPTTFLDIESKDALVSLLLAYKGTYYLPLTIKVSLMKLQNSYTVLRTIRLKK